MGRHFHLGETMRYLLPTALVISVALCVATSACDDDDSDTTPGGGGSAGATTSSTGAGGATTTATGGGGTGACYGDQEAWDQIPKTNLPCQHNSDCCVVFNGCEGEAQVVSADDFAMAAQVWPYCEPCVQCLVPVVEVECQQGECVGYEVPPDEDAGIYEGQDHCGVDEPLPGLTNLGVHFSC